MKAAPGNRLKVLHLAFEDHLRPGSGGGSLRSREINSRLSSRHDITVVFARYKGARRRLEGGVRYRPLGLPLGRFANVLSYHLALPLYLLTHRADLVIEDFAPPHSSDLVPLWTKAPTVAVAQFLFATEKSKQYHLPLWYVERLGARLHSHFIAVSRNVAYRIRAMNPRAQVEVVYAGASYPNCPSPPTERSGLLFLGRLEFTMKGLDLLVSAFEEVLRDWPDCRLRIAGDGRDRARVERLVDERGLSGRVDWLGRVEGEAKWGELRRAAVVVMPSRYETFGLVALEAMAVGAPVVAFALPSLRELVGDSQAAILVEPEDAVSLGRAASGLLGDRQRREEMGWEGSKRAMEFDWDAAAAAHERLYRSVVSACGAQNVRTRVRRLAGALRRLQPPELQEIAASRAEMTWK